MEPAVAAVFDEWERRQDSPARAVAQQAADLGFTAVLPDGAPRYVRLVHPSPGGRPLSLQLHPTSLRVSSAAAREVAMALPGAQATARDVRFALDTGDAGTALWVLARWAEAPAGRAEPTPTAVLPTAPARATAEPVAEGRRWPWKVSRRTGSLLAAAGIAVAVIAGATLPPDATTTAAADAGLPAATSTSPAPTTTAPTTPPTTAPPTTAPPTTASPTTATAGPGTALAALATLEVKGRAPKTGYDRDLFGQAWADVDRNGCDTRNDVLRRDLTGQELKPGTHGCVVLSGTLADPYSGDGIAFTRGQDTSAEVQIDHVVALSDAWQKGAQGWDTTRRTAFANDPLNLLAVDGPLNQQKSDGDAATWLPPNRAYRCAYVARQVAVKVRYGLWVTAAERDAVARVLAACPDEPLPTGDATTAVAGTVAGTPAAAPRTVPTTTRAPAPAPAPAPADDVYYAKCADAKAAGAAPLHVGDPGYRPALDRDHDGVACE